MADRRYIISRHKANPKPPFPEIPQWDDADASAGFVCLNSTADKLTEMTSLKDDIRAAWEADLPEQPVLIVLFQSPQIIPDVLRGAILPLKATRSDTLASYAMKTVTVPDIQISELQSVQLWWNGAAHYIRSESLRRLSLAVLWPQPELTIFQSHEFRRVKSEARSYLEARSFSDKAGAEETGQITVKTKEIPVSGDGKSVFSETDKTLSGLDEKYKLGNIFSRLFGTRLLGKGGAGKKVGSGEAGETGPDKGPGFFEGMAGWMRWHSPLGSKLAQQFGNRMSLVEKLINKGDIDSALKLALKLGGGDKLKGKSRFPFRLPDMRSGLDFKVNNGGFSMPILGLQTHFDLAARYGKLAQDLEQKGDYRRAAYIHSQLLDNHYEAVLTLERGELYEVAAKLALDSRQDPPLIIRLYYKAGKKDLALALAKKTDCFERLAEDSQRQDKEFHNFVVKAWTDMLVESGQPLRALEVTDELAKGQNGQAPDSGLIADRRLWLEAALDQQQRYFSEGETDYPAGLLCRALLYAPWDEDKIDPSAIEDFPDAVHLGANAYAHAFGSFQDLVNGKTAENLCHFLALLSKEAARERTDQAGFWEGPSKPIIDRFARNLLAHGSQDLTPADLNLLKRLVQKADLPVLAADLDKVKSIKKAEETRPNVVNLPSPKSIKARIEKACVLNNGSMVIWYETDRLELRSREGKTLWSRQVSQIKDLVPVGASPSVMVVQDFKDGQTRLTRLETHKRKFTDIGLLHLVAWHDAMSDGQWLVQIDNQIGAIDVLKLCQKKPELEFLWTVQTSNEMQVMAFMKSKNGSSWLTRNLSHARFGVMQGWNYSVPDALETFFCLPSYDEEKVLKPEIHWQWVSTGKWGVMNVVGEEGSHLLSLMEANYDTRKSAVKFAQRRIEIGYQGHDEVQVLDFFRQSVSITEGATFIAGERPHQFILVGNDEPEFRFLARGTRQGSKEGHMSDVSHICLCTDRFGRLIRIDNKNRRADVL